MRNRLDGWKEIAGYLHRSTRTAQRWERQLHLPVHRLKTAVGEIVYALPGELDEWFRLSEARNEPDDLEQNGNGSDSPSPAGTAESPQAPPARLWITVAVSALLLMATGLTIAVRRSMAARVESSPPAMKPPSTMGMPFASTLDSGPWPIQNHDGRRSNQGMERGPSRPGIPRLLYESDTPLYYAATSQPFGEPIAVTSDGKLIVGTCGKLLALDAHGRKRWDASLSERGFLIGVSGLAVDGNGEIVVATHACDESLDARKVKLLQFTGGGSLMWTQTRAGMYFGPAIGIDRTVFQMDEFNDVHAYANGMMTWTVDLPGYSQGAIALDSAGNLYVGTDGSVYGQPSFWSLDRAGRVRWNTGTETYLGPAVSVTDDVYATDRQGVLHKFNPNGREEWRLRTATSAVSFEPLAVAASGVVYVRVPAGLTAVTADGRIRWERDIPGAWAHYGPILDADENIYVAGKDRIVSLAPDGAVRWTLAIHAPGRLIMGPQGTLLVISELRRVYSIGDAPSR